MSKNDVPWWIDLFISVFLVFVIMFGVMAIPLILVAIFDFYFEELLCATFGAALIMSAMAFIIVRHYD